MKRLKRVVALICAMSLMVFPSFAEAAGTKVKSVDLNVTSKTVKTGDSFELSATTSPSKLPKGVTILWTIGNSNLANNKPHAGGSSSVVTLSTTKGNKVTVNAKKPGTVTITCCVCDNSWPYATHAKKTCRVKVKPITVERITLSRSNVSLDKGDTMRLGKCVSPSNAYNANSVIWRTGNSSVATVSQNGVIKAKGKGSCNIYCCTTEGNYVSATCRVIVVVPVKRVHVSGSYSVREGSTIQLRYSLSPRDASAQGVSWSSSNSRIATVNSRGQVTGKSKGYVTITCTPRDGSGKRGTKTIYVKPKTKVFRWR